MFRDIKTGEAITIGTAISSLTGAILGLFIAALFIWWIQGWSILGVYNLHFTFWQIFTTTLIFRIIYTKR